MAVTETDPAGSVSVARPETFVVADWLPAEPAAPAMGVAATTTSTLIVPVCDCAACAIPPEIPNTRTAPRRRGIRECRGNGRLDLCPAVFGRDVKIGDAPNADGFYIDANQDRALAS